MERTRPLKPRAADNTTRRRRMTNPQFPAARAQRAEDEFARFFAQSLDLLCIAGLDGYFKHLNPAWSAALGWTPEELKARPFFDDIWNRHY